MLCVIERIFAALRNFYVFRIKTLQDRVSVMCYLHIFQLRGGVRCYCKNN